VIATRVDIVCYNVGNAITNAKERYQAPALKKVRGPDPPPASGFDACVCT